MQSARLSAFCLKLKLAKLRKYSKKPKTVTVSRRSQMERGNGSLTREWVVPWQSGPISPRIYGNLKSCVRCGTCPRKPKTKQEKISV